MGQNVSCSVREEHEFFTAVQQGDLQLVEAMLNREPKLIKEVTVYQKLSTLHAAAASGQSNVLSVLLDRGLHSDVFNRHKQTPLMLAARHGRVSCIRRLLQADANVLLFDSLHGRTCLHYAAKHGHEESVRMILLAAHSAQVEASWGFVRFVNVRDGKGATPLHLAARSRHPGVVRLLLENGALVCASTGGDGPGSTALHFAARGGCVDCVRELLAWGADRIQRDSLGRIPYGLALKFRNTACVALLNPNAAEPLIWPSPWKFISELNPEAKLLLRKALMEANQAREKISSVSSPAANQPNNVEENLSDAGDNEVCCICFDKLCTIVLQNCGHQMCAMCTVALCCYNKPNPAILCSPPPVCPFCRSNISQLVVAQPKRGDDDKDSSKNKIKRCKSPCEGSSSFKGISVMGSFSRITGKTSGKIADSNDWAEKP